MSKISFLQSFVLPHLSIWLQSSCLLHMGHILSSLFILTLSVTGLLVSPILVLSCLPLYSPSSHLSLSYNFVLIYYLSHAFNMSRPSHPPLFYLPNDVYWISQIIKSLIFQYFSSACFSLLLRSKYFPQTQSVYEYVPSLHRETLFYIHKKMINYKVFLPW
jgi:hypothetical protein